MSNFKQIVDEAAKALNQMESGDTYLTGYVVERLEKAAVKNPQDQLICNMRDVFVKQASSRMFTSQTEVGDLFEKMYGLSGGHTAFRTELEDLLPESLKFTKVAYTASKIRTMEEVGPEPIHKDSALSNAFSVLFSMSKDNSFASFSQVEPKAVEKVVITKLSRLGKPPLKVSISDQNEHFALATATYQDRNHKQLNIHLPVQIVNGNPVEPGLMVQAGQTVELNKDSLYIQLKETSNYKKVNAQLNMGLNASAALEFDRPVLPVSLESVANFETDLIKAANHFSVNQVNHGISLLSGEIAGRLNVTAQIKVGNSDERSILFKATIPTKLGKLNLDIPVEYHNGQPILPSRFVVNSNSGDQIYDFSKAGFTKLQSDINDTTISPSAISRDAGPMSEMSYHQLMDQVISGAAHKDYQASEDALGVISSKFGGDIGVKAMMEYANLLKVSSGSSDKRKEFIKNAERRKELIHIPTTVELYSPKLGLPVSRIDFDTDGYMYPKGRVPSYENITSETEVISTSKIHFS